MGLTNQNNTDGTYYFPDYYVKTGYSGLDPNLPVSGGWCTGYVRSVDGVLMK
jgi:hypothetical protein